MLAFEWNFLRKLRTGIGEPIYENFVMKMLKITKIKARPFQFLGSVGKYWAGRICRATLRLFAARGLFLLRGFGFRGIFFSVFGARARGCLRRRN
ncbi:hypothetical protein [Rhodovulum sulfidophilum]|uniref:Uncharacterized protein n=1 Tax=Rhodovulum sulfidophilum TaxID=35806 RepID=A0ABS1RZ35_RHOSU|nr:hypothetical protein [Rhodovulum sulfidophilum]MBL3610928.1 hypothetical protein [Rhodovulum sulfidophilum]MCE8457536.1 hypothetical protein [Rhodovulum sulfidophilum]